jgi:hypothetical protein
MTGDKNMHSFDLDDRDITYSVDGYVTVGERVTVTEEKGDDKVHRITVKLGGSPSAFRGSKISGIPVAPGARAFPERGVRELKCLPSGWHRLQEDT